MKAEPNVIVLYSYKEHCPQTVITPRLNDATYSV